MITGDIEWMRMFVIEETSNEDVIWSSYTTSPSNSSQHSTHTLAHVC